VDEGLEERLPAGTEPACAALLHLVPRRSEFVGLGRLEGYLLDGDDQLLSPGA